MSTKISTTDLRNTDIEFEDISNGTMFTEDGYPTPYIKMPIFYVLDEEEGDIVALSEVEDNKFNAIDLCGERYWFDPDSIIHPIEKISITMK
jgi:hypothetical protein